MRLNRGSCGVLFLTLAVQGKLVQQDSNDDAASMILERIQVDADAAVKSKKMRKIKEIEPLTEMLPFEIPYSWQWTQLGCLASPEDHAICDGPFGSKLKTEHYLPESPYMVIRLGNIGVGKFIWGKQGYISREHYELLASNHVMPGDLIVAGLADPLVRCCDVPVELGLAVNKADCFRVRLHDYIYRLYIMHYLNRNC